MTECQTATLSLYFDSLCFLFCRLWIAFVSFRKVRGLMVFFPFLKFMIAHSGNSGLAREQLIRKLLRFCPDLI